MCNLDTVESNCQPVLRCQAIHGNGLHLFFESGNPASNVCFDFAPVEAGLKETYVHGPSSYLALPGGTSKNALLLSYSSFSLCSR
jgi:hypothetical protein